ncbi:hypothetical protein [uncultured Thomasclavelia sp.]|uniref:hypothetical protein n=1 Tax=uncultured Thomasclavelia sp. TaxID=3025759 RepID=UPI002593632B|nr:hypothetical protein [uncultured Thomasclavelia sp.]
MTTKYEFKEIFKLGDMLDKENIEYKFTDRTFYNDKVECTDYQIELFDKDGIRYLSVIQSFGSYGREKDLLEIMGLLTPEEQEVDSIVGYLTAENVFERIKRKLGR